MITVTPVFRMGNGIFLDLDLVNEKPHLKGKRAILKIFPDTGVVHAQFDDSTLLEGHGWHPFDARQFMIIPKIQI